MIYDNIENLERYGIVSEKVLRFLHALTPDIATGRYEIDGKCYANIETYNTKPSENAFSEAHKNYIDIQILLAGSEKIEVTDVSGLKIKEEYDSERDIMFFYKNAEPVNTVVLSGGKFALIFPHEAHTPQLMLRDISQVVKKVVVKVPIA